MDTLNSSKTSPEQIKVENTDFISDDTVSEKSSSGTSSNAFHIKEERPES